MPYHFPPNPFVNGQWGVIGNWEAITTLDDSAVFWFLFAEGDRLWAEGILEFVGNVAIEWTADGCKVAGEVFKNDAK